MDRKYFGTDGIRGRVGKPPITADFMLKLGWAAGRVLGGGNGGRVLIGKDTRSSGYMFEAALEAGLSAAGVNVALLGPMPTPGIAYLTRTFHANAGIVISASHNAYQDNGIKFFGQDGQKLPDEMENAIEVMLDEPMSTVAAGVLGKAERITDAAGRYIEFCKSTVPMALHLAGLKVVIDCANGATYHVAPNVFSELGARVSSIGVQPDGLNINLKCGSTSPQALQSTVLAQGADLGIAFDGDGDRVIMVDGVGEVVDGDEILYILARDRARMGTLGGNGVVGTQMSNLGLELALKEEGIALHRAKVGDRYVMEALLRLQLNLGGEGSGHIICLDRTSTGDGVVSALQVLAAMSAENSSLRELRQGMVKLPQVMINVPVSSKKNWLTHPRIVQAVNDAEVMLGNQGRVLLRPSGTEPVVRVMVEGENIQYVEKLANEVADVVRGVVSECGCDQGWAG